MTKGLNGWSLFTCAEQWILVKCDNISRIHI